MYTPLTPYLIGVTFDSTGAGLLIGLMFAVGAALGSFFNVVAYRVPRRMSLSHPGSRCPACSRPIRWYDNVPIFGWLVLRGRCRDCRSSISARYPIVELLVALASALVTWSAIVPVETPELASACQINMLPLAMRLVLVWVLFCATLFEFDGHVTPSWLLVFVMVIGALLTAVLENLYEGVRGLAAGVLVGLLAWPALVNNGDRGAQGSAVTRVGEMACVGIFLGLQATAAIAVFAIAWLLVTRILARFWLVVGRLGWASALVAGTLIWLLAGEELAARWPTIDDEPAKMLVVVGAIVAVLAIACRVVQRGQPGMDRGEHA